MTFEMIDTHCHLNHEQFAGDWAEVYQRAEAAGVSRFLCIGFDFASSRQAAALAAAHPAIYAAAGIHPESVAEWGADKAVELAALFAACPDKLTAYGEIGLDYHWEGVARARQQEVFAAQIAFASALRPDAPLPLIIHNRDALHDVLAVLKASGTAAPVVMHCFTGDTDAARLCLDAGCFLGVGGVATFKNSGAVRDAIAYAPLARLLLETDCPYLAPQLQRGRRNEPSFLPAICETVAAAKALTVEEVARATTATARTLFGMG